MIKELSFSILIKLISFLSGIYIALNLNEDSIGLIQLVYIIGFVNLAKSFDGALPYLQRIEFSNGLSLKLIDKTFLSLLIYSLTFLVSSYFLNNIIFGLLTSIYAFLFAQMGYFLNILRKSYLINLPQILAIIICIAFANYFDFDIKLLFLISASLFSFAIYVFVPSAPFSELEDRRIINLYNKNYFFNFFSVLIFMVYAEFASVVLYGAIPISEYADVNKITKIQQAFIGFISIFSTVLWNKYHTEISVYDKLSMSFTLLVFLLFISFIFGNIIFNYSSFFNNFFNNEYLLMIFSISYIVISSINLMIAQILSRLSLSGQLLSISIAEAALMIVIFFIWSDVVSYFYYLSLIHIFKFIAAKVILKYVLIKD